MSAMFFGKYRGVVRDNIDPMQLGRVRVQVPDVLGAGGSAWAMPCIPCNVPKKVASSLPEIGATVWVEFEQGDRDYPIWTGCFYRDAAATPPSLRKSK